MDKYEQWLEPLRVHIAIIIEVLIYNSLYALKIGVSYPQTRMWQSQIENIHYSYHILTTFLDFVMLQA